MSTKFESLVAEETANNAARPAHLIVTARAGTGKTTTLIEGLKYVLGKDLDPNIVPSLQQSKIWEAMKEGSENVKSACFIAFNKSIVEELKERVPQGSESMTCHSLGFKAVKAQFPFAKVETSWKTSNLVCDYLEMDQKDIRKKDPKFLMAVEKLVGLCKLNLVSEAETHDITALNDLADYYDVDLGDSPSDVFEIVPVILEMAKDLEKFPQVDFNDMVWLPIVLDLAVQQFDLLLIDEAQDLNRCQQALTRKAGRRLIYCGDDKQAIYGFAGADAESLTRLSGELSRTPQGCNMLPLTVTYRCGRVVVERCQKLVPDFEAHENNPEGKITEATFHRGNKDCYQDMVQAGDMVLSRVNGPLVSECLRFLRHGQKATIQGRDIGKGLLTLIKKLGSATVEELIIDLGDWLEKETEKENKKKRPMASRLIILQDRFDCIVAFCDETPSIDGVVEKIQKVFSDKADKRGIKFSSIHRAKGLESSRVFVFQVKSCNAVIPHPMAKSDWQIEQEWNLLYVAQTRAINELVIVTD